MRKSLCALALLITTGLGLGAAPVAEYPDAHSLATAIAAQLGTVKDYTMIIDLKLQEKEYVLDYRCVRPADVRTEILDGRMRGISMAYRPDVKPGVVVIRSAGTRIVKSVEKLGLKGNPLIESVLDRFSNEINALNLTVKPHTRVSFEAGRSVPVADDREKTDDFGDDRDLRSLEPLPGPPVTPVPDGVVTHDCYLLEGPEGDARIAVAVDSQTLWPVTIEHWKGNHREFAAEVWDIKTNTAPNLEP